MTFSPGATVLVTGASGLIGSAIRPHLTQVGWHVRGVDRVAPADGDPQVRVADALDPEVLDELAAGCAGIVHLSGIPHEASFEQIHIANALSTQRVLEAAVRHDVPRIVLAGSNHAVGMHERPAHGTLPVEVRPRPDTFYGVSKATLEALGQLYADRLGREVVSLRIGSCHAEPASVRELSTWLSLTDVGLLVDAALRGPVEGHVIAYGVSNNTRNWWDLTTARALGYDPVDDAEHYVDRFAAALASAAPVPPGDRDVERVGGPYTLTPVGGDR